MLTDARGSPVSATGLREGGGAVALRRTGALRAAPAAALRPRRPAGWGREGGGRGRSGPPSPVYSWRFAAGPATPKPDSAGGPSRPSLEGSQGEGRQRASCSAAHSRTAVMPASNPEIYTLKEALRAKYQELNGNAPRGCHAQKVGWLIERVAEKSPPAVAGHFRVRASPIHGRTSTPTRRRGRRRSLNPPVCARRTGTRGWPPARARMARLRRRSSRLSPRRREVCRVRARARARPQRRPRAGRKRRGKWSWAGAAAPAPPPPAAAPAAAAAALLQALPAAQAQEALLLLLV